MKVNAKFLAVSALVLALLAGANETVTVTITFVIGGQEVEGLFLDSVNLRKVSQ